MYFFLGRTISQSEFRVKNGEEFEKDELYYRLNVRPNKNMTASTFWESFIYKLIYDNEALIVQADDGDLLIADDFEHNEYAVFEDTFTNVTVKDYQFKRSFKQSEVIHLRYRNDKLSPLIDGLFTDYGDLFGRILSSQNVRIKFVEQLIWTCSLQRAKNTNQNCKSSLITCTKRLEKRCRYHSTTTRF